MTSRIGPRRSKRGASGFTLIELVLVMAILIIVMSMSATSLSSFFRGRALQSEGSRFVALTRYAQDRAVGEGYPMTLWIAPKERKYGLQMVSGYTELDEKAAEFELSTDLQIEVNWSTNSAMRQGGNEILMRFSPDAFLDEGNPDLIVIKGKKEDALFITPNRMRTGYEINTNYVYGARR